MPSSSSPQGSTGIEFTRTGSDRLKSIRLELGLGLREVAERLDVSPQAVHQFEKSETAGTISLRQLENVAHAMGRRVVYALVPARASRRPTAAPAAPATLAGDAAPAPPPPVEHSMFLENLAADRFD